MIWNEDFEPKIRIFWVFGVEGKEKNEALSLLAGFRMKIVLSVS